MTKTSLDAAVAAAKEFVRRAGTVTWNEDGRYPSPVSIILAILSWLFVLALAGLVVWSGA